MKILSSDFLIADSNVDLKDDTEGRIGKLIEKYRFLPGEKYSIDLDQYHEFIDALEYYPVYQSAGGTASNILYCLASLGGSKIEAKFIGALGGSQYSKMIKQSLDKANIQLIPDPSQFEKRPEAAITYNLIFPGGKRASVTYPGNAKEVLKPEFIRDEDMEEADAAMVLGSLWQKLGYLYPDTLMEKRWAFKKQLLLCMPTNAEFGIQKAGLFQRLTPRANNVLSNGMELARVMEVGKERGAIQKLQDIFRSGKDLENFPYPDQLGFITLSTDGCSVITKEEIIDVPAFLVPKNEVINEMGAGDTTYGAFLFGIHIAKLSPKDSALMAMAMGAEKVKIKKTRLDDPAVTYASLLPKVAEHSPTLRLAMPKLQEHFRNEFGIVPIQAIPETIAR